MTIIPQLVLNSLIAASIYSLMALGFNLIYDTTKFFNLAHGTMAVVGGYATFFISKLLAWPLWLGVILGVVVAGLAGFSLDKLIYLPLRQRKASNMVLLVASLGAFTALQALVAILFTSQFQTLSDLLRQNKIYELFGGVITQIQLIIILATIVGLVGLVWLLNKTLFGKAVKAIGDDEEVAKIIGINTNKIIGYTFLLVRLWLD